MFLISELWYLNWADKENHFNPYRTVSNNWDQIGLVTQAPWFRKVLLYLFCSSVLEKEYLPSPVEYIFLRETKVPNFDVAE